MPHAELMLAPDKKAHVIFIDKDILSRRYILPRRTGV